MPADIVTSLDSESRLLDAALALGAETVPGWSRKERDVFSASPRSTPSRALLCDLRSCLEAGGDPLGEAFCRLRTPQTRRASGATYTPSVIVESMVEWADSQARTPGRVVDPGAGSGRFAMAAGRRFGRARLLAVEADPVAAIVCRGNLAALGMGQRATVINSDYRSVELVDPGSRTLYLGNPPYLRHHEISAGWKDWLNLVAKAHGLDSSRLAGLHVYFFLATAAAAQEGDLGAFVTSSEWLDTNYGALVRELLLGILGGDSLHVLDPALMPFDDANVTAAITCFRPKRSVTAIRVRRVERLEALGALGGGDLVSAERLREARRWSPFTRAARRTPRGHIELGEICRVHRGTVTGKNSTWVVRPGETDLPETVLFAAVTRAREIIEAGPVLHTSDHLRLVVDLPPDLSRFDLRERRSIKRFLRLARREGADAGYIARNRRNWWSVGLGRPAPILTTYMARRPPAFTRNLVGARHINVAHGLYPRVEMSERQLERLVASLQATARVEDGRTYAGGLTKFEPREMERLAVPNPLEPAEQ